MITCNQIGDLNRGLISSALDSQNTERGQAVLGISEGSFAWGGYFGRTDWADPKERLDVPIVHGGISPESRGDPKQLQDAGASRRATKQNLK